MSDRITRERFEAWADEIGLDEMQRDRVLYVLRREFDRGRRSTQLAEREAFEEFRREQGLPPMIP